MFLQAGQCFAVVDERWEKHAENHVTTSRVCLVDREVCAFRPAMSERVSSVCAGRVSIASSFLNRAVSGEPAQDD